ncbi:hypothetical protein ABZ682_18560 [Streptomyces griseoviridis]|uniref:hypothetical protein n=1 Tax=Streptomyces griseoviridis TaxID=45398 RepID=UPI0033DF0AC4
MTALASARATTGVDPLTLTLLVSSDQKTWHPIVFEGESPACVDKQAAAWLRERPYLSVEMDDSTCYGQFPRTFNAVFASVTRDQQLVQVHTL